MATPSSWRTGAELEEPTSAEEFVVNEPVLVSDSDAWQENGQRNVTFTRVARVGSASDMHIDIKYVDDKRPAEAVLLCRVRHANVTRCWVPNLEVQYQPHPHGCNVYHKE